LAARGTSAGGALAGLSALVLFGCLDTRTLEPLPLVWLETNGGQAGASDGPQAGFPGDVGAGSGGTDAQNRGGTGGSASKGGSGGTSGTGGTSGSGGTSGTDASGSGKGGAGSGGSAGHATGGSPDGDCLDLDSNEVPDCQETLVKNGSFDTSAKSWIVDDSAVTQSWDHRDADDQSSSGSLVVTNKEAGDVDGFAMVGTQQCLPVDEQGAYRFVAQLYISSGQGDGNGGVNLWFFNLPDCQGSILNATTKLQVMTDTWQMVYAQPVTPMGARSVAVRLVVSKPYRSPKFSVSFDNVLFAKG